MSYTRVGGGLNTVTTLETYVYTPAGGATSVSGADANGRTLIYTPLYEMVFLNGVRLVRGDDYTATNGSSITGLSALSAGDVVEVVVFQDLEVANAMTQSYADGTYVGKALISGTKGAVPVGTGSTVAALSPGANGEVLYADSSATNGLRWQGLAGRNRIINGGFDVWQRGTTFTPGSIGFHFTADRWRCYAYANSATTVSRQAFTAGTAPVAGYEGTHFLRITSSNTQIYLDQNIEDVRTFAGQTVTVSLWAKQATGVATSLGMTLVQYFGSGGSANVNTTILSSQTTTTGWTRYTGTASLPSIAGKTLGDGHYLAVQLSNGGLNNALDIWGFQLEAGNVATRFEEEPYEATLRKCQRYYQKSYNVDINPGTNTGTGVVGMLTQATSSYHYFPQVRMAPIMRSTPTITVYSSTGASGKIRNVTDSTDVNATAANIGATGFSPQVNNASIAGGKDLACHFVAESEL